MNRSLLSRIMPFLLLFYALSLGAFFAYAIVTFSASNYLPALRWEYAIKRAFVLFMDYLIPVHAAAVAVAASLSFDAGISRPGGPARPFSRIVSSTLVAFLVLTAVYTALAEGVAPGTRKRLEDMRYLSRVAVEYRRQAAAAMQGEDYRGALEAIDRYLVVDPGNKEIAEQRLVAVSKAARKGAPRPAIAPAGETPPPDPADVQKLVEAARKAAEQKNWLSSQHYARAAIALDPRRVDALQLASEAGNRLAGLTRAEKDDKTAQLYKQKKDALELLDSDHALAAYYAFVKLSADDPKDADIQNYLAEAGKKVRQAAFFLDEARKIELLPGTQGILFLNRYDAESTEAVSIGKMVELSGGDAYFFNIEAVHFDASGAVAWHFTAPYGRRDGDAILMHGVNRTNSADQKVPNDVEGTRPEPDSNILRLYPTVEELRGLSSNRTALAGMNINEMWRLRERLGSYGLARQSISVEMTMRLVMPFAFLILSILCTAMGWSLRVREGGRLPAAGILLMPLLPVVLALMSLLYLHAHRVLIGFTVIGFGLTVAFIALAALQLVLLALSMVLLAGQSSR
ncbi:MAG: LptF/LptG family permease [Spirochaetia bacterium]|jgi:tetratricopeptide (TPR) repeat protein